MKTAISNPEPEEPFKNPVPEDHIEAIKWFRTTRKQTLTDVVNVVAAATFK